MSKHPSNIKSERKEFNPVLDRLFKNAGIGTENNTKQNWSEVEGLYEAVATSIVEIATEINHAIKVINLLGIQNNAELATSIKGLTRDIETFSSDLVSVKNRHSNMSGPVKNGEELALCMSVFEDYVALNDRFRANVFPVVLTVTEHLNEAVASKNQSDKLLAEKLEAERQSGLTDPTVVSDIEVKESKND